MAGTDRTISTGPMVRGPPHGQSIDRTLTGRSGSKSAARSPVSSPPSSTIVHGAGRGEPCASEPIREERAGRQMAANVSPSVVAMRQRITRGPSSGAGRSMHSRVRGAYARSFASGSERTHQPTTSTNVPASSPISAPRTRRRDMILLVLLQRIVNHAAPRSDRRSRESPAVGIVAANEKGRRITGGPVKRYEWRDPISRRPAVPGRARNRAPSSTSRART